MNEYEVANDIAKLATLLNSDEKLKKLAESSEKTDAVSHPAHYNMGGIEVIDAIEAWGFGEGFNRGCAIKYIARAGRKGKDTEIQDLRKAIQYLQFEIERLEQVEANED